MKCLMEYLYTRHKLVTNGSTYMYKMLPFTQTIPFTQTSNFWVKINDPFSYHLFLSPDKDRSAR